MKTSKILAMVLCLVLCLSLFAVSVFAETAEQDGVQLTLTTDKAEYAVGDEILATLKVENLSTAALSNVALKIDTPAGFVVTSGSASKNIEALGVGASENLEVGLTMDKGPAQTGDESNTLLAAGIAVLALAGMVLMFVNKRTACMAIALFMLIGVVAIGVPVKANAASAGQEVSITVKVDGKDVTLKATANYEVEEPAVVDNGPLPVLNGNITYDPATGKYTVGEGDAYAMTDKAYPAVDLTVTFCPDVWPIQGFVVKNGDNLAEFWFGSEGYDTHHIMGRVNGQVFASNPATAFNFSLVGAYSYEMKLSYDGTNLNMYVKQDGSWTQINKDPIDLAALIGSGFDAEKGVQVGIGGFNSCGRMFSNAVVTEKEPVGLNGPLPVLNGNITYDPATGKYTVGEGDAYAMTDKAYPAVDLTVTFCPDVWPIQGFVVKNGDNLAEFWFGSEGYDTHHIMGRVNGQVFASNPATAFNFSLVGAYSYEMKLSYDGTNLNMYVKQDGSWTQINKDPIDLAALIGSGFDAEKGVQVGIGGFNNCGRMFSNAAVTEKEPVGLNGPLPVLNGNITYDPATGKYTVGEGDAYAMTDKAYPAVDLTVTFCPDVWPIQGFVVKNGDNLAEFWFGSEGYDAHLIMGRVNGQAFASNPATAFNFSLVGAYSYEMKLSYDGANLNMYVKQDGSWTQINKDPIDLAALIGSGFDAEKGVQVGIGGFNNCGRMFSNAAVTEKEPVGLNGPLPVLNGNITYDSATGMYVMGEGDAFAMTEKTYQEVELSATFCPDVWPVQGFAVKQGNNTVVLRFGSEGYDAHRIMVYVNDFKNEIASIDTAFDFSLVGAYSYDMKMTFDGATINLFVKENGSWKQINKEAISLAEIPGSNFDSSEGIAVGIAGLGGCGRQFKNVMVTAK